MHAVLNSLKPLKCIKCCRQTSGFDQKFEDIDVWQQGIKKPLNEEQIMKSLNESKVLRRGVSLHPKFIILAECINTQKFASGICNQCAKYYDIDSTGKSIPYDKSQKGHATPTHNILDKQITTEEIIPPQETVTWNINPYSSENLMTTCIWKNADVYKEFVKNLNMCSTNVFDTSTYSTCDIATLE